MIVVVIMPMIIGAIAVVIITSLRATDPHDPQGTAARLAESHDAQITSALFVRDVQSSTALETLTTPLCGIGTQLVGLEWNTGLTSTGPTMVSYVSTTIGGTAAVVRYYCPSVSGVNPTSKTAKSTSTVSHDVGSSSPTVTLVCASTYTGNCVTDAGNSTVAPISSLAVATIQISMTEKSGFVFTLTASPRQQFGSTPGVVATAPPLLLLGSGGASCAAGNPAISVNGEAAVNSSAPGSLAFHNGDLTASQVYSQNPNTSGNNVPVSPPGNYVQSPSGPPGYVNGPALTNPYATLPAPSQSGPNTYTYPAIPATQPAGTPTFIYPGDLSAGNDPVTGNLFSGIYIVGGNLSGALASDPGGVFIYMSSTTGSVDIGGNSNEVLAAMTTGTYAGILIDELATNTTGITLHGGGTLSSFDGVIVAPGATISLKGNGSINVLGLVADSVECNGNGNGTFGPTTTTTSVSSSLNPSATGQSVTFSATVAVTSGSTAPTPSGTVTFNIAKTGGGTVSCSGGNTQTVNGSGLATCTTPALSSSNSPYDVTATYNSVLGYQGSSGTLSQSVQSTTSTAVTSSANPSVTGQSVTFTATVSSSGGTPTGSVTFAITATGGGTVNCNGSNAQALNGSGMASCTTTGMSKSGSTYTVTASYPSTGNFQGSSGSLSPVQTVNKANSATSISSSANPSQNNHTVTFTITVVGASGGTVTATGNVTITIKAKDNTTINCSGGNTKALNSSGQVMCTTSSNLSNNASKTPYTVNASYVGDANYNASAASAFTQNVQ